MVWDRSSNQAGVRVLLLIITPAVVGEDSLAYDTFNNFQTNRRMRGIHAGHKN